MGLLGGVIVEVVMVGLLLQPHPFQREGGGSSSCVSLRFILMIMIMAMNVAMVVVVAHRRMQ